MADGSRYPTKARRTTSRESLIGSMVRLDLLGLWRMTAADRRFGPSSDGGGSSGDGGALRSSTAQGERAAARTRTTAPVAC